MPLETKILEDINFGQWQLKLYHNFKIFSQA